MPAKTPPEIGLYGVVPDMKKNYEIETTVFTIGGTSPTGAVIAGLHLTTWLLAFFLIMFWGNNELGNVDQVHTNAKNMGSWYGMLILAILLIVVLHAMFAKKDEKISATVASVILLWIVFFELSLGCAYLAYSMAHTELYFRAMVCQLAVTAGCAMIVTFYVNFTQNGNLDKTVLSELRNGQGGA